MHTFLKPIRLQAIAAVFAPWAATHFGIIPADGTFNAAVSAAECLWLSGMPRETLWSALAVSACGAAISATPA